MSHADVAEWQTRMLEGHVGDRAGSSPVSHTKVPDQGQELFFSTHSLFLKIRYLNISHSMI